MKELSNLIDQEIFKILNQKSYFNNIESNNFNFSFYRSDEGVFFNFKDNSLQEQEYTLWLDNKDLDQNHTFNEITSKPTQTFEFTKLLFLNKPLRVFTKFIKYKSKTPSRSYASKTEYVGTWFAPYVTEWTHIQETEKIEIDEEQLKSDLFKNKIVFIKKIQQRIYLNNLFKEYKNLKHYS